MAFACAVAIGGASCASAPVRTHAQAITEADYDAKRALAGEAKIDAAKIPARSISVMPFTVSSRDTSLRPLAYAMSDFLSSDLSQSPDLKLVERQQIDAVLRELSLVDAGVVDPRSAPRIGRLVGARRILIGDVSSEAGGNVVLNARVVDVIAGTVQPLVSGRAPLNRIIDAEKALALRVFEELGVTLSPARRAIVEQRQTTDLQATVAYGRGLRADAHGNAAVADTAFQDAARLDVGFAAPRVQLSGSPSAGARSNTTAAKTTASAVARSASVQRMLDLSTQVINTSVPTNLPDVATGNILTTTAASIVVLTITVHVP
jgi:TolB-like protein